MTPQSSFMILAPIAQQRENELRQLLASMNSAPGRVNPENPLIPFARFKMLHFARLVILEDQTIGDVSVYGLPITTYPLCLAFLGDIDGDEDAFLRELAENAEEGLRAIFSCCEGFEQNADLDSWMRQRRTPSVANYVNTRGRTVRQIQEEAALRKAVHDFIASNESALRDKSPAQVRAALVQFILEEKSSGRLTLSEESPTPLGWWIGNVLHLIGLPLPLLLVSPILLLAAPFYLWRLRHLEQTDPEVCPAVSQGYSEKLSLAEDHDVTNQFSAMGSLKPGFVRLLTVIGVLSTVNYAARHFVRAGRLGRIRTIHFARWVFLDSQKRMVFFSNYDGSVESYMDDFINKTGFGLNASFSNGIGYPKTNWLVLGGCSDERKYKEFLRRHTIPTQVWYKAYPGLTAIDLERNTRIRRGLDSWMSDEEARDWLALL